MGRFQKQVCQFVLDHFERTYGKELGECWMGVRQVLTTPGSWQYAVLLNSFTSPLELEKQLHAKGYRLLFNGSLSFCPETLKCYINQEPGKFPGQRHRIGKLKDYYILNASSLLPVLALHVQDGERVLDMCAAPGGKSIALLQCASPGYLHCNEADGHRYRWLKQTLESFVPSTHNYSISTSEMDGRLLGKLHSNCYDKVLVDAPCSNDRSWLFSSDIEQAAARISQRKMLPLIQIELLRSAIQALRPGGSLVYSTCTLSRAENSDVISSILNLCSNVVPVDLSHLTSLVTREFTFATDVGHGLLVVPDKRKSWGPMFLAKLMKT